MLITRQNPKGGPTLRGFPIEEDDDTGVLGYKVGYCPCGCGKPLLIRTLDVRAVMEKFGYSMDQYDSALFKLKRKYSTPLRERIIKFLGGKVEQGTTPLRTLNDYASIKNMKETEKPKEFTREYFVEQGRKGGEKVKELYGLTHFQKIRKKGIRKKVDKST